MDNTSSLLDFVGLNDDFTASPMLTGSGYNPSREGTYVLSENGSSWMYPNSTANFSDSNVTESPLSKPSYYAMPYRVVGCFFIATIFLVGLIGNVMVVIVVIRTRSMHTPTNCYLVSLAVADVLVLVSAPLPTIIEFFGIVDQCLGGPIGCSLMVFVQYLGINASSLSITAFTVERYIAICHPMRAQAMCTVRRAKRIIAGLWVFGTVYCAPWLALTVIKKKRFSDGTEISQCTFKLERSSYVTIYIADLLIFYILPLLLTCILYGLIARILFTNSIPSTPGKANGVSNSKKSGIPSSRIQVSLKVGQTFLQHTYF